MAGCTLQSLEHKHALIFYIHPLLCCYVLIIFYFPLIISVLFIQLFAAPAPRFAALGDRLVCFVVKPAVHVFLHTEAKQIFYVLTHNSSCPKQGDFAVFLSLIAKLLFSRTLAMSASARTVVHPADAPFLTVYIKGCPTTRHEGPWGREV
jgi:hypothetical protein